MQDFQRWRPIGISSALCRIWCPRLFPKKLNNGSVHMPHYMINVSNNAIDQPKSTQINPNSKRLLFSSRAMVLPIPGHVETGNMIQKIHHFASVFPNRTFLGYRSRFLTGKLLSRNLGIRRIGTLLQLFVEAGETEITWRALLF